MTTHRFFVAGTDTGVGKTRVAASLCRGFATRGVRTAAMKPVASGCMPSPGGLRNEDALALIAAMNVRADYSEVNPYAFEPAIAPHIAAADVGIEIDFSVLDHAFERLSLRCDVLVVEGAGGWLTPLGGSRSFADLAARWQMEVILVVGMRLGCLNHALLTRESIERRGLCLSGWVANLIDPQFARLAENVSSLQSGLCAPCLGVLPFETEFDPTSLAARLAVDVLTA